MQLLLGSDPRQLYTFDAFSNLNAPELRPGESTTLSLTYLPSLDMSCSCHFGVQLDSNDWYPEYSEFNNMNPFQSADRGNLVANVLAWKVQNTTVYYIPDLFTIESPVTVSGMASTYAPSNLLVRFDIHHTCRADLRAELIAPDGSVVRQFATPHDCNDDWVLSERVDASVKTFNGQWKLRIADTVAADTGYLRQWSLSVRSDA